MTGGRSLLHVSNVDIRMIAGGTTCMDNLHEVLSYWIDYFADDATIDKLVRAIGSVLVHDHRQANLLAQDEELQKRFGPNCKCFYLVITPVHAGPRV